VLSLVTAVVKPHKLDAVKEAVTAAGVRGVTVTEVRGFGRQSGHTETYRGSEYTVDFIPKVRIEVLVDATQANSISDAIADAARTGSIGDGKIWVTSVDRAIRIRTGELDIDAL